MAIIVRRPWDSQPQDAPTVRSSLRGVTGVWLGSQPRRLLVRNTATSTASSTVSFGPGPQGLAIQGAGGDSRKYVNLTTDVNTLLPNLDRGTIAIYRQCRDTTLRNSNIAAGDDGSGRISVIAPWSSGSIFFDWGNASNRLTVGGFVKTLLPEALVFTNGPAGGQRAYRNGTLLGSDAQRTRGALTCGMNLAGQFDTFADDNEFIYLAVFSAEEWLPAEVARWSAPGQQYAETFEPRRIWIPVSAAAGGASTITAADGVSTASTLAGSSTAASTATAAAGTTTASTLAGSSTAAATITAAAGVATASTIAGSQGASTITAAAGVSTAATLTGSSVAATTATAAAGASTASTAAGASTAAATITAAAGVTTASTIAGSSGASVMTAANGVAAAQILVGSAFAVATMTAAAGASTASTLTGSDAGATVISVVPPYITVYMFKRTA